MAYQIGQIQFEGSGCMESITPVIDSKDVTTTQSGRDNSIDFKDVSIAPSDGAFETDKDYYLHLEIPRDINYQCTFNVKLTKGVTSQTYQFVKQITVERGGNGNYAHPVVLYAADAVTGRKEDIRAMIPKVYQPSSSNALGDIYYMDNGTSTIFYLGGGGTTYVTTDEVNMIQMSETWRQDKSNLFGVFDMVFRPLESGFTEITLEMVRNTIDYAIQTTIVSNDGSTSVRYGREVDISQLSQDNHVRLYTLNNQVSIIKTGGVLNKIGIWGHPGLIMAINGEEIRIGPSGYYEEGVVPVASLGIAAADNDYRDSWTLDYEINEDEGGDNNG